MGILYIESWLRGVGAAAINNLMEDAATAEISRAQVWPWLRHGATGGSIDTDWYKTILGEELEVIRQRMGSEPFEQGRFSEATALFDQLVTSPVFEPFLNNRACDQLR